VSAGRVPKPVLRVVLEPVAAVAVLVVIGGLGLWAHDAWLVPSLGSAVFVQVMTPELPSGRLWSTAAGQAAAMLGGYAGVFVAGAAALPPFMSGHPLLAPRLLAAGIAVAITALLQRALQATSPAGGATALLLALGAVPPTIAGALVLAIGIALVCALGEAARVTLLRLK
jgi:hypothetical protein